MEANQEKVQLAIQAAADTADGSGEKDNEGRPFPYCNPKQHMIK